MKNREHGLGMQFKLFVDWLNQERLKISLSAVCTQQTLANKNAHKPMFLSYLTVEDIRKNNKKHDYPIKVVILKLKRLYCFDSNIHECRCIFIMLDVFSQSAFCPAFKINDYNIKE